jgi:ribosome biogenesis GTPase
LARPDTFYSHLQHVIVANIDQLLIVASWRNPHLWPELIDRYLITAERNGITPIICVNKVDLAEASDDIEAAIQPYRELGVEVILTSAERGDGLTDLREQLQGKISVLAGLSGVGKSSLLTAIQPDFDLRISAVNDDSHQGRHTTTQTNMLPFGDDGYVIDTPGIREFGLAGLHQSDLVQFYPELVRQANGCRFSDCAHQQEPDCAVRASVEAGTIPAARYQSYVKIWGTLPE